MITRGTAGHLDVRISTGCHEPLDERCPAPLRGQHQRGTPVADGVGVGPDVQQQLQHLQMFLRAAAAPGCVDGAKQGVRCLAAGVRQARLQRVQHVEVQSMCCTHEGLVACFRENACSGQQLHGGELACTGGVDEGHPDGCRTCTALDQPRYRFITAGRSCQGQGRVSVLDVDVHVGTRSEKLIDHLDAVLGDSLHESCLTHVVSHIRIHAGIDEQPDRRGIAKPCAADEAVLGELDVHVAEGRAGSHGSLIEVDPVSLQRGREQDTEGNHPDYRLDGTPPTLPAA